MVSNLKPVYLLAGGRPRGRSNRTDTLIESALKESGIPSPVIAYVGTANGDDTGFFYRMAEAFRETGAKKIVHALISPRGADLKKAKDILKSSDIVFVSGGGVDEGMRVLEEKDMVDFLRDLYRQGKPFFGLSAGSIMLAKEWVRWRDPRDESSAELFPCLDIAPIICDCHDEESGWQELKAALRLEKDNVRGYGIVGGAAIKVFPDSKVEALGDAIPQYIRRGGEVKREHDIKPVKS
jgi:peptidase E